MKLEFEYAYDWRTRIMIYRHYFGTAKLVASTRRERLPELWWSLVLWIATLVALRARAWVATLLFVCLALWKLFFFLKLDGLGRRTMFMLREGFRKAPQANRLVVAEDGIREFELGIESFAPWSSVKRFFVFRSLVGIELANGFAAYVSEHTLSARSSSLVALVEALERHNVPRVERIEPARPSFR
jgi:hypothetical protein